MSDRCYIQKKINKLLIDFKNKRLPKVKIYSCYLFFVDFLNSLSLDNKLMSAVYHDLQVLHFRVACQAHDLIDKYVTGPL